MVETHIQNKFICMTCHNKDVGEEFKDSHEILGHKVGKFLFGGYKKTAIEEPKKEAKKEEIIKQDLVEEFEDYKDELGETEI